MGGYSSIRHECRHTLPFPLTPAIPYATLPLNPPLRQAANTMDQTNELDETPTIRSLSSREANKDARAAFNYTAVLLAELPDGRFAICDRGQNFYLIVAEPPTRDELRLYNRLLQTSRMSAEGRFYGEPDDRTFAREIRLGNQPTPVRRPTTPMPSLKIELKI